MTAPTADFAAIRHLFPESTLGEVSSVTPIRMGLSGAGVYAIVAPTGEYVLRVQGDSFDDSFWTQQLLILRRAADAGIAPPIVHIDEGARAVVSRRIAGVMLKVALAHPAQRAAAITDVVDRLRLLHEVDPTDVAERSGIDFARGLWHAQRVRAGFPSWAADVESTFEKIAATLARDPRRVVSHNDLNPGNVLWDGARSWLVDWEVAGLAHPYGDLAAFVTFLDMDDEHACDLLGRQEQSSIDDVARATFTTLRQLVSIAVGYLFLSMVPDLTLRPAATRADAPTLTDCRNAMRNGGLDLQTPAGRAMYGLAFLRGATGGRE
jgi:thiamine kinase-like enzyme